MAGYSSLDMLDTMFPCSGPSHFFFLRSSPDLNSHSNLGKVQTHAGKKRLNLHLQPQPLHGRIKILKAPQIRWCFFPLAIPSRFHVATMATTSEAWRNSGCKESHRRPQHERPRVLPHSQQRRCWALPIAQRSHDGFRTPFGDQIEAPRAGMDTSDDRCTKIQM